MQSTLLAPVIVDTKTLQSETCSVCGKQFYGVKRKRNLRNHVAKHEGGEARYVCDHCTFRTSEKYKFQRHIKTHTGEKPYKCPHCDYRAAEKNILKRHIENKHVV